MTRRHSDGSPWVAKVSSQRPQATQTEWGQCLWLVRALPSNYQGLSDSGPRQCEPDVVLVLDVKKLCQGWFGLLTVEIEHSDSLTSMPKVTQLSNSARGAISKTPWFIEFKVGPDTKGLL